MRKKEKEQVSKKTVEKKQKTTVPSIEETEKQREKRLRKEARLAKRLLKQQEKEFKNLDILEIPLTPNGILHKIYKKIPDHLKVTSSTPKGTRVLVARWPPDFNLFLKEWYPVGTPGFPKGGVLVYNEQYDQVSSYSYESVAIHPIKKIRKQI